MFFDRYLGKDFSGLKQDIESHPRMYGHYIVGLVELNRSKTATIEREEILDAVFQHFDPSTWPPPAQRPQDQSWEDYECSGESAREHTIEALMGGHFIGHSKATMDQETASGLFERFESFFESNRKYYFGLSFGDRKYTFQHGCAMADAARIGVLCLAESD